MIPNTNLLIISHWYLMPVCNVIRFKIIYLLAYLDTVIPLLNYYYYNIIVLYDEINTKQCLLTY